MYLRMNIASVIILLILAAAVCWALKILRQQGGNPCRSCERNSCAGKKTSESHTFDKCNCHK